MILGCIFISSLTLPISNGLWIIQCIFFYLPIISIVGILNLTCETNDNISSKHISRHWLSQCLQVDPRDYYPMGLDPIPAFIIPWDNGSSITSWNSIIYLYNLIIRRWYWSIIYVTILYAWASRCHSGR